MANTVIGSSIVIDGEISGDEDLVIQGTVKGKISLKESLFVEGSGTVEADIDTQNVEVAGKVTGNISASDKVELKSERVLEITYRKDQANAGQVLDAVQKDGYGIVDVSTKEPDLEDVFLNLTRASNVG